MGTLSTYCSRNPTVDNGEYILNGDFVEALATDCFKNHHGEDYLLDSIQNVIQTLRTQCTKPHMSHSGKYEVDGCQKYVSVEKTLLCGYCGCHQNFHRNSPSIKEFKLYNVKARVQKRLQELKADRDVRQRLQATKIDLGAKQRLHKMKTDLGVKQSEKIKKMGRVTKLLGLHIGSKHGKLSQSLRELSMLDVTDNLSELGVNKNQESGEGLIQVSKKLGELRVNKNQKSGEGLLQVTEKLGKLGVNNDLQKIKEEIAEMDVVISKIHI